MHLKVQTEQYIGGFMAIDIDNFIFHSDYVPYPRVETHDDVVSISGTLAAGANVTFYGSITTDVSWGKTQPIIRWTVPNSSWVAAANGEHQIGAIKKGSYAVNKQGAQLGQPTGIWAFPFVSVVGGQAVAAIKLFNNQVTSLTVPTTDFNVRISTYSIPI